MSSKFIMFIVALLLIDAAILGNIGSILGAIIDPANMNDISSGSSSSSSSSSSSASSNPNGPYGTPGYYPPGTTIPQNV